MFPIARDFPTLEAELRQVYALLEKEGRRAGDYIGDALRPLLSPGGKALRPVMTLASARLGPNKVDDIIALAASVEMIHAASLIHDDIIDDARIRRGASVLHRQVGVTQAVLAGDWLLARALALAGEAYDPKLFRFLADRIQELCVSEIEQDSTMAQIVDSDSYFRRIDGKTGALFRLACRTGAGRSGADPSVLQILDAWATTVGRGFQLTDDALDYVGRKDVLGKTPSADLKAGLASYPVVVVMETHPQSLKFLSSPRSGGGFLRRRRVRRIVLEAGGVETTLTRASELFEEARKLSGQLVGDGAALLDHMVDFLDGRDS